MLHNLLNVKGSMVAHFFRNPGKRIQHFDVEQHGDLLIAEVKKDNIILNQGKAEVIKALAYGNTRILARMAIGDRGTIPSDSQVPKVPTPDRTSLYHEVYRQDIQTMVVTTEGSTNEILSVGTFDAVDIPLSSFLDQTRPMVNEVGLVMCDINLGRPLPRPAVASPDTPDADEALFNLLTFNSVPFKAEEEVGVTVRYKIYVV